MSDESKSHKSTENTPPVVIKKYANRRLYNTHTSSYVTLEHLARMVKDGQDFIVHDAKTGDDITRSVLTQIIVEEEAKGQNLLPISFLRRLIALYGDNLQGLVPQYLDVMMQSFSDNQDQIRKYLDGTLGGFDPFQNMGRQMEEFSRDNMKVFEQTMNMFTPPPARADSPAEETPPPSSSPADAPPPDAEDAAFDELKSQLQAMQRQLDALTRKTKDR